jgi:hypothetical protein
MGQQQLLLVILGVIIVGIAIAIGISLFGAQSIASNRDAMINDLNHLASFAYQFRVRLHSMGGGEGDYTSFAIPPKMTLNEDGTYSVTSAQVSSLTLLAVSATNASNTIGVTVDSDGKLMNWSYGGDFQ